MATPILFTTCDEENPRGHKCPEFSNDGKYQCSCACHADDRKTDAVDFKLEQREAEAQ